MKQRHGKNLEDPDTYVEAYNQKIQEKRRTIATGATLLVGSVGIAWVLALFAQLIEFEEQGALKRDSPDKPNLKTILFSQFILRATLGIEAVFVLAFVVWWWCCLPPLMPTNQVYQVKRDNEVLYAMVVNTE